MALPILDGNQSATTLSTIITGGAHIPAHTVVSLGTQAKSDITSAISGSVVSISNFPSTQTVAGTVTANVPTSTNLVVAYRDEVGEQVVVNNIGQSLPVQVFSPDGGSALFQNPLPISGTVTANVGAVDQFALKSALDEYALNYNNPWPIKYANTHEGDPLPISGTVTAAAPNGSLTTRFGTPTTANTAFATSAVTNANRKYLLIQNVTTGSNVITVGIGFTPTTTQGIQLTAGAGITFESSYIPTGQIFVLSSVTASNFTILEA